MDYPDFTYIVGAIIDSHPDWKSIFREVDYAGELYYERNERGRKIMDLIEESI